MTDALNRRRFLQMLGIGGVAAAGGTVAYSLASGPEEVVGLAERPVITSEGTETAATPGRSAGEPGPSGLRTLVVLEMSGGNDALNTLIPQSGAYYDNRPTIAIPQSDQLELAGLVGYGLHPSLEPLEAVWERGDLGIVSGVGFEGASRSHFEAMDWWWAGRPGPADGAGWLGRWLDLVVPGDENPLVGVSLGSTSAALTAATLQPTMVASPAGFTLRVPRGADEDALGEAVTAMARADGADDLWQVQARSSLVKARSAVDTLAELVTDGGASDQRRRGGRSRVSELMSSAAAIIGADLGTRVIVVNAGGYDTHANQLTTHAGLLSDMATGVASLLEEVAAMGRSGEVLILTTSEFGRRVHENGSAGTDHGRAGVQFLAGAGVAGGLIGEIALDELTDGDLTPGVDVRSLYQEALGWLGGPTSEVLDGNHEELGLVA